MLLFRDEEHVGRWCRQWHLNQGAILTLPVAWDLALAWFNADRGAAGWRRPAIENVEELFASLGLAGEFWRLR
jgi:hypothetical protein